MTLTLVFWIALSRGASAILEQNQESCQCKLQWSIGANLLLENNACQGSLKPDYNRGIKSIANKWVHLLAREGLWPGAIARTLSADNNSRTAAEA